MIKCYECEREFPKENFTATVLGMFCKDCYQAGVEDDTLKKCDGCKKILPITHMWITSSDTEDPKYLCSACFDRVKIVPLVVNKVIIIE